VFAKAQRPHSPRGIAGLKGLGRFEMMPLETRLLLHGLHGSASPLPHFDEPLNFAPPAALADASPPQAAAIATHSLSSLPRLNSNPAAAAQIFLDFDGDPAARWGAYQVTATPAYDRDGDATTFSDAELTSLRNIWSRVAEKYSPFKINVTTVDPGTYLDNTALRVVIGGEGLWSGGMYGGLAYVGSFFNFSPNTVYVFPENLGYGAPKYVAEAAAHEAGHGFGLEHQSSYDANGRLIDEYSEGNGQIAPIMGNSYYARGLWSNGATTSPTTFQNDLALLASADNGFGYRTDDHGNTPAAASSLRLDGITATSAGIIGKATDADYFKFTTGAGTISFNVKVAQYGPMLDLKLVLKNAAGATIASADTASLGETLTFAVDAGAYTLGVLSEGNYGDIGQYTITGTLAALDASLAGPSGLTATVDSGPQAVLNWTDNATGEDGFKIQRSLNGGLTWEDLGTTDANITTCTDTDLTPGTTAMYRVYAFNATGESDFTATAAAVIAPDSPTGLTATGIAPDRVRLTWSAVTGATAYVIERSLDGLDWQAVKTIAGSARAWINAGLNAQTTYSYRIIATNAGGDSSPSDAASATTLPMSALPAAPTDLSVTRIARYRLRLNWTDNADNETGFAIQWSGNGNIWHTIGRLPADLTSVDVIIRRARTNYFRIYAFNSIGGSPVSQTASGVTGSPIARTTAFSSRPIRVSAGRIVRDLEPSANQVF
jgi:hypothetical protein